MREPNHKPDVEPAPRPVRETQPPPIDETDDDTRIVFVSWDCALVPKSS